MSYISLSYFLDADTPLYGGGRGIEVHPDRDIQNGDTANTKFLKIHNHSGTHIDFPNHFFSQGKFSHQYEADFWIFGSPYLLEQTALEDELIDINEKKLKNIPEDTDFLIIKTRFGLFRHEEKYWKFNPGLSPELAIKIRHYLPKVRAIGVDLISITSFQNREIGRLAHRNFLGQEPILLVEDMNLEVLKVQPLKIMCFPLLVQGVDGAPVNIIAEI